MIEGLVLRKGCVVISSFEAIEVCHIASHCRFIIFKKGSATKALCRTVFVYGDRITAPAIWTRFLIGHKVAHVYSSVLLSSTKARSSRYSCIFWCKATAAA